MNAPNIGGGEGPSPSRYRTHSIGEALAAFLVDCSPLFAAAADYWRNGEAAPPAQTPAPLWREVTRQMDAMLKRRKARRWKGKSLPVPHLLFAEVCAELPFGSALAALVAGENPACPAVLVEQGLPLLWEEFLAEAEAVLARKKAFAEMAASYGSRSSAAKALAAQMNGRKGGRPRNPTPRARVGGAEKPNTARAHYAQGKKPNTEVEVVAPLTGLATTTTTTNFSAENFFRYAMEQDALADEATRFANFNERTGFRKTPQEAWKIWAPHRTPAERNRSERIAKSREAERAAEAQSKSLRQWAQEVISQARNSGVDISSSSAFERNVVWKFHEEGNTLDESHLEALWEVYNG